MGTGDTTGRRGLSEGGQKPRSKPPLGPPHDTYATVAITLAFAGVIFFAGRGSAVTDTSWWIGMVVFLAAAVALTYYFQRAYGFTSRGWGKVPIGARAAVMFGFIVVLLFVPEALYEQYFQESLLGYLMACLALAMLTSGTLRAALGKANSPQPTDETLP